MIRPLRVRHRRWMLLLALVLPLLLYFAVTGRPRPAVVDAHVAPPEAEAER